MYLLELIFCLFFNLDFLIETFTFFNFQVELSDEEEMDEKTPALKSIWSGESDKKEIKKVFDLSQSSNSNIIGESSSSNIGEKSFSNVDETSNANVDERSVSNISQKSNSNIDETSNSNVDGTSNTNVNKTSHENVKKTLNNDSSDSSNHNPALFYIDSLVFPPSDDNKVCYSNANLQLEEEKLEKISKTDKTESSSNLVNNVETSPKNVDRISAVRQRVKVAFEHLSVDNYDLPPDPSLLQRLKKSLLLPPHGPVGQFSSLVLVVLTLWITW